MKDQLARLAAHYFHPPPQPPQMPALEWLSALADDLTRVSPEKAGAFIHRASALIVDIELEAARRGSLFAFTRPILSELRQLGIRAAIITRNCERAVRMVFPDLDEYCSAFLAREHVPRVKPDPDHLVRAMQLIGVPPEFSLMVGDHPLDMQTGSRAGIRTAGVSSGNVSRADLLQSGALWTAGNCRELLHFLRHQGLFQP
jgi:phosphoglycolate phosphatase